MKNGFNFLASKTGGESLLARIGNVVERHVAPLLAVAPTPAPVPVYSKYQR